MKLKQTQVSWKQKVFSLRRQKKNKRTQKETERLVL